MAETPDTPDLSSPQVGLWLTLAQAFLPPMDGDVAQAFLDVLSEDLRELCAAVGLPHAPEIATFEDSLATVPDPPALLEHYSRLFLVPYAAASLELGHYLEGALEDDGRSVVDSILARHGARRREDFRGSSDHITALLESMALLSAETGSESDRRLLAHEVLRPALPGLVRDITRHEPGSPYRALAQLAQRALDICVPYVAKAAATPDHVTRRDTDGAWRACRRCGNPFAREEDLVLIRRALLEHGIPVDHLDICPACRNPATAEAARPAQAGRIGYS